MISLQRYRTGRVTARPKIEAEGERLLGLWGAEAADIARILAFRAEAGLLHESELGFWRGVVKAIGHRIGLPDGVPQGNSLLVM